MAANPPGNCCMRGFLFNGTPSGKLLKLDDGKTDAYIAEASSDKAKKDCGIIYLPDIYGIWQNSKLMADHFATHGYTTLVVDLFNGDPVTTYPPVGFDILSWTNKGTDGDNPHTTKEIDPIIENAIQTLKSIGVKRVGAVGYCFGAKYVVRHFKSGIDVGYAAHPSSVEEEELSAISGPYALSAAEVDPIFPAEKRHKSEEILAKTQQPYQINLFYGVEHGFAVRGDMNVRATRFAKEQAFVQAVTWFDEFLMNP